VLQPNCQNGACMYQVPQVYAQAPNGEYVLLQPVFMQMIHGPPAPLPQPQLCNGPMPIVMPQCNGPALQPIADATSFSSAQSVAAQPPPALQQQQAQMCSTASTMSTTENEVQQRGSAIIQPSQNAAPWRPSPVSGAHQQVMPSQQTAANYWRTQQTAQRQQPIATSTPPGTWVTTSDDKTVNEAPAADGLGTSKAARRRKKNNAKKAAAAVQPDELQHLMRAVQDTENATRSALGTEDAMDRIQIAEGDSMGCQQPVKVERKTSSSDQSTTCTSDDTPNETSPDPLLLELESSDEAKRQAAMTWVSESFWVLAITKRGCRIVQKAIDVGSPAYQQQLVKQLTGRVMEALQSPHANYVLQKFIETIPPEHMEFVLTELQEEQEESLLALARHRFGCRILQRVMEQFSSEQAEPMIDKILTDIASLSRHQYGNFVVQHILQNGLPSQRHAIAVVVGEDIIRLSKHRIASHVVSSAMINCPTEDVERLTQLLLSDAGQLTEVSRRQYGSFVVREVKRATRLLKSEGYQWLNATCAETN